MKKAVLKSLSDLSSHFEGKTKERKAQKQLTAHNAGRETTRRFATESADLLRDLVRDQAGRAHLVLVSHSALTTTPRFRLVS